MEVKKQKTVEDVRADARQRKRDQRDRDYAARDQARLSTMDPAEANVERIMAQIALEPRQPRPPRVPSGPPEPARLPSLVVWSRYLKSICQTQAIEEELERVEAAIANGMTEFPHQVGEVNET